MNTIENIKLKNQSKAQKIKRIFATLLASMVALITATMSGSVYAESVEFAINSNNVITSKGTYSPAISFGIRYLLSNQTEIALCFVPKSVLQNNWGADYTGLVVTKEQNDNFTIGQTASSGYGGTYNQLKYSSSGVYIYQSSETGGQFWSASPSISVNGVNTQLQVFNSLSDVCAYYATNWVAPSVTSSRKLEAGNVAIIDFGSGVFDYDLSLTSYHYQKSGFLKGANVWNENGQAYYWSFTLPESGDSVSGTQITWDKAPSALYPQNAIGQTHYGISQMTGTGAARYLLIINPYVNQISENGQGDVNGWINIDGIPEGAGVYVYPMQQSITGLSNENVISPTEENPGGYGVATSQGGIVDITTIGGEAPYTQTTGGANSSMPLATIGDYVEDINNTLNGFSQNFLNLLKAPIEYIKALVEGAQNFFAYIAGLFTWLPQDINAFVITGLMLVVIIGIFHSLL